MKRAISLIVGGAATLAVVAAILLGHVWLDCQSVRRSASPVGSDRDRGALAFASCRWRFAWPRVMKFSPDGHLLAIASNSGGVELLHTEANSIPLISGASGRARNVGEHKAWVADLQWRSPAVALAARPRLHVVDVIPAGGNEIDPIYVASTSEHLRFVVLSPGGLMAAVGSFTSGLSVMNMEKRIEVPQFRVREEATSAAYSRSGRLLAVIFSRVRLVLYDANSASVLGGWDLDPRIGASRLLGDGIAFSPDEQTLYCSQDKGVVAYDIRGVNPPRVVVRSGKIMSMAAHPRSDSIVVGTMGGELVYSTWVGSSPSEERVSAHVGAVRCVAFREDGQLVASAGDDGRIRFWRAEGNLVDLMVPSDCHDAPVVSICSGGDEDEVLSIDVSGVLRTWRISSPNSNLSPIGTTALIPYGEAPVRATALAALRGPRIAGVGLSDGKVLVVDVRAGEVVRVVHLGSDPIHGLWQLNDGSAIAATSFGAVWRFRPMGPESPEELRGSLPLPIQAFDASDDGSTIACALTGPTRGVLLRSGVAGREDRFLPLEDEVQCCALSPDGRLIAVGYGTMDVWLISTTGQSDRKLVGHHVPVRTLAFSRTGALLVSSDREQRTIVWNMENGTVARAHRADLGVGSCVLPVHGGETVITGGGDGLISLFMAGHHGPVWTSGRAD